MNKKFILVGIIVLLLFIGGLLYRKFVFPQPTVPPSGRVLEIEMRVLENQWKFEPNLIEVSAGDRVILNIFNEDTYDHGLAIDAFGINKRLIPKEWTKIEFLANRRGEFIFYCSVPCGKGHFDQKGNLIIK